MRGLSICGVAGASERASHRGRKVEGKEAATPNRAEGVSVYYPFALLKLLDIGKTEEHAETGEVLLYFLDADGCQVTLRLSAYALVQLRAKLTEPPPK